MICNLHERRFHIVGLPPDFVQTDCDDRSAVLTPLLRIAGSKTTGVVSPRNESFIYLANALPVESRVRTDSGS